MSLYCRSKFRGIMKRKFVNPITLALGVEIALICFPAKADFNDDFSTGTDNGWTHLEPLASSGVPGTFTFPNGGYRIQSAQSPDPTTLGPARVGSLRSDLNFGAFEEHVYIMAWNNNLNQSFGLLGRGSNPGFGTTGGYALTYSTAGSIDILRFDGDQVTPLVAKPLLLDPSRFYVLRFECLGNVLSGLVYDPSVQSSPILVIQALDNKYGQGIPGIYLFSNSGNGTVDATFDNYAALSRVPEPSTLILGGLGSIVFFLALRRQKQTQSKSN